jgi:hypothetical protein
MRAGSSIGTSPNHIGRPLTLGRLIVPVKFGAHHQPRRLRCREHTRCEKRRNVSRQLIIQSAASPGSESEGPKSAGGRPKSLLHSIHDRDIVNLAVPALFSILLDPIMSLTDTGEPFTFLEKISWSIHKRYILSLWT